MTEWVIQTQGLTKRYGDFTAVDHLDLQVAAGEIFGMLGPNGSGKTTTILMLLGLTEPTEGTVRVLGLDPARQPLSVKARVGYIPDQVGFYEDMTGWENLVYIAKLNGIPRPEASRRIEEALSQVGLTEVAGKPVGTYSRGMRQRLGVAEVLIKRPALIILDEPTLGLDPEGARDFLALIRTLKMQGITVLLASHLLHQVQSVCDRVGLFHQGRMVLEGTVAELARRVLGGGYRVHIEAGGDPSTILAALRGLSGATRCEQTGDELYVVEGRSDMRSEAARAVVEAGGSLRSLRLEEPSLDDVYARYFQEVEHGNPA